MSSRGAVRRGLDVARWRSLLDRRSGLDVARWRSLLDRRRSALDPRRSVRGRRSGLDVARWRSLLDHRGGGAGPAAAVAMMGWLTLVLWLDRADGAGSHGRQLLLGVATWVVLVAALAMCTPLVRAQTLVVIACATAVEFTFSPLLEVYLYRFHNVPAYVPPGHGLVYLSAYALGHWPPLQRRLKVAAAVVAIAIGAWATYGWLLAERRDGLGFFWFLCLAGFLVAGPSRPVYVGAAVAVTWLELTGTHFGNWAWQPHDPILGVSVGNPPSGAAGGYGWFDLAGLLLAPRLLRLVRPRRREPLGVDAH